MKSDKRLSTSALILITSLILSSLCFASMTVSIDTDETSYELGDNVTFTGSIVIEDESGCCGAFTDDNVSLMITDGNSIACSLKAEEGYYQFGGNCSLEMNVTETHPADCASYGGNNTIEYVWIYWTIPLGWNPGGYSATITATACDTSDTDTVSFSVNSPATTTVPATTTIKRSSGGGGGGGGGFSGIPIRKETCYDGLKNCHDGACEEDVDCGGPCEPCPSCTDGILNQGEEAVDCGGPCKPCVTIPTTTIKPKATTTTTPTTVTTSSMPATTSTIRAKTITTTTTPAAPAIPLGATEGVIILLALILIAIAVMIQMGKI